MATEDAHRPRVPFPRSSLAPRSLAQELATPLRVMRPVCVGSVLETLPDPVSVQVGMLKLTVNVPSLLLMVRVKLIGIPHANAVEVLIWKGVILVPVPSTAMFG